MGSIMTLQKTLIHLWRLLPFPCPPKLQLKPTKPQHCFSFKSWQAGPKVRRQLLLVRYVC
uniref:Uncharacterized protein n=1 Tax=Rhizophora mucronata TaxID=61149 RepID=A0A2P2NK84_RHIMU